MSTHAIIARPHETGVGLAGRYCHFDGSPTGVGRTLYQLHQEHFRGDTAALCHFLIDEHPAGWSQLDGADFALEPAWIDDTDILPKSHPDRRRPHCYCHGQRQQGPLLLTQASADLVGMSYVYILGERTHQMLIYGVAGPYRYPRLRFVARVDLSAPEPDWQHLWKGAAR